MCLAAKPSALGATIGIVKVFISSLISGYEAYRQAVVEAVEALGHQVIRAEEFPASAGTPQQACLAAVRESDLVVLLIGERYGYPQPSGLSATHEEYREAKESKPVFVFVESGVTREPQQETFLQEVEAWATGHFRASFSSADELKTVVVRALHDHELATAAGPVDEAEMLARARALLPNGRHGGAPRLVFAVAGGPHQQVLRPVELEQDDLARDIQREALFGEYPVFDATEGTTTSIRGGALILEQPSASVVIDQAGSICVVQPARRNRDDYRTGMPALIEEDLAAALARAVRFSGSLLDRLDPVHRLTDVVPLAHLSGTGYLPWRSRAEQAANPNSASIHANAGAVTATLTPTRRHRQALTHDANRMVEDLMVLLRREIRG
ncbi:uncharacterized protein DUF4062 [Kribbella sp. VKM Ac-2527]|uniref:Uncharacterized protein DUF4062 n=1 Tax=Kribbella caucasensis TaxID=2512215 RepID=A0A4R6KL55_9ACTN|nr:uncharacterized protein DUF4062 [Kribbella sp. VKM Ac-2527]